MNSPISFNGSPRFSEPLSAPVNSQETTKSEVAAKESGHIDGDKRASVGNGDMAERAKGACKSNGGILSSLSNMLKSVVEKFFWFTTPRPQEPQATPSHVPLMPSPLAGDLAAIQDHNNGTPNQVGAEKPATTPQSPMAGVLAEIRNPTMPLKKVEAQMPAAAPQSPMAGILAGIKNPTMPLKKVEAEKPTPNAGLKSEPSLADILASRRLYIQPDEDNETENQVKAQKPAAASQSPTAGTLAGSKNPPKDETQEKKPAAPPQPFMAGVFAAIQGSSMQLKKAAAKDDKSSNAPSAPSTLIDPELANRLEKFNAARAEPNDDDDDNWK